MIGELTGETKVRILTDQIRVMSSFSLGHFCLQCSLERGRVLIRHKRYSDSDFRFKDRSETFRNVVGRGPRGDE